MRSEPGHGHSDDPDEYRRGGGPECPAYIKMGLLLSNLARHRLLAQPTKGELAFGLMLHQPEAISDFDFAGRLEFGSLSGFFFCRGRQGHIRLSTGSDEPPSGVRDLDAGNLDRLWAAS